MSKTVWRVLLLVHILSGILLSEDFTELDFKKIDIKILKKIDLMDIIEDEGDINRIRVDSNGFIYVNFLTSVILYKLNPELRLLSTFNRSGEGPGEMRPPIDFVIANENIYVTDNSGKRLNVFNLDGTLLKSFITNEGHGEKLFIYENNGYGLKKNTVGMVEGNTKAKSLSRYKIEKHGLLEKERSCGEIKTIGTYLANQISGYSLFDDSLLISIFHYLDRLISYDLKSCTFIEYGSPAKVHQKSPVLGNANITIKSDGGKSFKFKMTGDEYICYSSITQYNNTVACLLWARQGNSFSMSELFGGETGGKIVNFFEPKKGKYLYSIKMPHSLGALEYSLSNNRWIAVNGSHHEISVYTIEGI